MDIDNFKSQMKKVLDFIPQVGDTLWVSWMDDLPSQHKLLKVEGDHAFVSVNRKARSVRVSQLNQVRPYISDKEFELNWHHCLGGVTFLYHWFAENTSKVCLNGVTNGKDLAIAIKQARYKYHTGREWSEFTGDKTK